MSPSVMVPRIPTSTPISRNVLGLSLSIPWEPPLSMAGKRVNKSSKSRNSVVNCFLFFFWEGGGGGLKTRNLPDGPSYKTLVIILSSS